MQENCIIPAAQYLRMSTEHQQYSIANQAAAIRRWADERGFVIVKTYSDAAKSGLQISKRLGLNLLLQDVISRKVTYKAILVYDVSRWGRFQDSDEAAHYEFLCRQARVPVHYCAETFPNDGSLSAVVMKTLKRAMAAEYSRELGVKVFAAEKRWAELGFKQGGAPGYGLRRMMISSDGSRKQLLAMGEVKCLQSDRVILIPGDPDEVRCVREMYRMLVEERRTPFAIARELNRRGLTYRGAKWKHQQTYTILTHPKYAGCNVWNRRSRRLGCAEVQVPESKWVVKQRAFESIIDPDVFSEAQRVLAQRTCAKSNERIVEELRTVLTKTRKLTGEIIRNTPGAPSVSTLRKRFGGLRRAFELAGYRRNNKLS